MMWELFRQIWSERAHVSEISGTRLGPEPLSTMFHHVWPKKKFPALKYVKCNIVLITPDEHATVESDMYRYPVVNSIRESVGIEYDL